MKEIKNKLYRLYNADFLDIQDKIKPNSISLVLCDLPYGTTKCSWDITIPFEKLWNFYEYVTRKTTPILLFGVQPFTSLLISSNLKMFKYTLVWEKERPTNILFMKKQIGRVHEDISVFYRSAPIYNPIMEPAISPNSLGTANNNTKTHGNQKYKYSEDYDSTVRYPRSVLKFTRDNGKYHPTQKPVKLLEYLIKTFSNKNDIILDNTMGSGSTGIACLNTGRRFIGIEKDKEIFKIAYNRITSHKPPFNLFGPK